MRIRYMGMCHRRVSEGEAACRVSKAEILQHFLSWYSLVLVCLHNQCWPIAQRTVQFKTCCRRTHTHFGAPRTNHRLVLAPATNLRLVLVRRQRSMITNLVTVLSTNDRGRRLHNKLEQPMTCWFLETRDNTLRSRRIQGLSRLTISGHLAENRIVCFYSLLDGR